MTTTECKDFGITLIEEEYNLFFVVGIFYDIADDGRLVIHTYKTVVVSKSNNPQEVESYAKESLKIEAMEDLDLDRVLWVVAPARKYIQDLNREWEVNQLVDKYLPPE